MSEDIGDILEIYGVMFKDPICLPYMIDGDDIPVFIEEVKKAIETKTPINKSKWFGDGSTLI